MTTDLLNTKIGQPGSVTRPGVKPSIFSLSSEDIKRLIANISQYKQPADQTPQVRPLRVYEDLAARQGIETVTYKNPKPVEVPGQQAQVPELSVEPGIKTAPTKDLLGQLKLAYQLVTDPALKKLFKNAIIEQQGLA